MRFTLKQNIYITLLGESRGIQELFISFPTQNK